jgi:bifunctional DNA-binding transcriptional regulator/antitoxin component of YhaV-PrlF toxin-antitoxin module
MPSLKLTSRGQVTLRKEILRHFGVQAGDRIDLQLLPGGKGVVQAERKKGRIRDLAGCLKGKTNGARLTIEEMNEAIGEAVVEEFLRGVQR